MISDPELLTLLDHLLRRTGPAAAANFPALIRHLETILGLNLSHKTPLIRAHINLLLSPLPLPNDCFAPHPGHAPQYYHSAFCNPPPSQQHVPEQVKAEAPVDEQDCKPVAAPASIECASTGVKRRGGPGGLNKVCRVTPELQAIVGEPTMARTEIVKQLWAYIRKHNCQDPNNKRKIICNDELRILFETDCTDMFKMNKLLAKHIITLEPTKSSGPQTKKQKTSAEITSTTELDSGQNPIPISSALAIFFGNDETEMLQADASKRVWDYIKTNHLEDPMNPMMILCDSKLQQLFGVESLSAFGIQDKLTRHMSSSNTEIIN